MSKEEHFIEHIAGKDIFYRSWKTTHPKAIMVLVHGLGEHSGRLKNNGQYFVGLNFLIRSFDLPGHGQSSGPRGHAVAYVNALEQLPLELREIVILHLEFGLSHAELAEAVGAPSADAARMRLRRALSALALNLGRDCVA